MYIEKNRDINKQITIINMNLNVDKKNNKIKKR